jgi:N-acetylglucosamine kinase-like BadF-type ATPase
MSSNADRGLRRPPAVFAVDVGNSKTDVALVSEDGEVLAALRGPTSSHQQIGPERCMATLLSLAEGAAALAGLDPLGRPLAGIVAYCAAGVDLRSDERLLTRGMRALGLAPAELVVNDCYGALRAGTDRSWGVCVISGSGMNCLGVAPNGRTARFDALGEASGDWGGGDAVGQAGLAAAVRAHDGRGPATILARTVPAHFGLANPRSVTLAVYRGAIPLERRHEIAPLVFEAACQGDPVARGIADRMADEAVAWAAAAIRRLKLQRLGPDVVLAGGIFRAEDPAFYARIVSGIVAVAPSARVVHLAVPPVVGSALLGLDRLGGGRTPVGVERRLRAELTAGRLAASYPAAGK